MIGVVIAALDPPESLPGFVRDLRSRIPASVLRIVVVDDGSRDRSAFRALENFPGVTVLRHHQNQGKGAALKTGFRHLLSSDAIACVVTADADGQHLVDDVIAVCVEAESDSQALTLGARTDTRSMPMRSRIGSRVTRTVLRWIFSIDVKDSQTGLRAIPRRLVERSLEIKSSRYAFELDMLLLADSMDIRLKEIEIATIYVDRNRGSHFRPVRDSIKVYFVFLRYLSTSLTSFCIDIALFALLNHYTGTVMFSTYAARIGSGAFNFLGNRHVVFYNRARSGLIRDAAAYVALAVLIATVSGYAVRSLSGWMNWAPVIVKLCVDPCLFLFNFAVQRYVIFKPTS